jgi:hypothetical protein
MAELSPKQHYLKHLGQLKNERTSFEHWRELAEFIDPRSTRFLTTERNNGSKRNTRIVDPTASKLPALCNQACCQVSPAQPAHGLSWQRRIRR